MDHTLPLSEAKARLSEVVRTVRQTGEPVTITVDGKPAVTVAAVQTEPRRLTAQEVATDQALARAAERLPRAPEPFDAVDLIREGRR